MKWLGRLLGRREPPPMRGVPAVRRQKNYSAASGYAYEYFFEGYREEKGARRYQFTVSADRKSWFGLEVAVEDQAVAAWERRHGRALGDNERYAVAKMALFEAFDERPNPEAMRQAVRVGEAEAERLLERLGID